MTVEEYVSKQDYAKLAELNRLFKAPAFVGFAAAWWADPEIVLYDVVFPGVPDIEEGGTKRITYPGMDETQVRRLVNHPFHGESTQAPGDAITQLEDRVSALESAFAAILQTVQGEVE